MNILPKVAFQGKEYFIDMRLREFRSNTRPIEFVPFDSDKGRRIHKLCFI
jgi:hypothetical protein